MCRQCIFCLLVNINSTEQTLKHFPQTQELRKLSRQFQNAEHYESNKRIQALQTQLRLAHIKKGKQEFI
jgi:hypothetical protein